MINDDNHVAIIILNWNTWTDTVECLESVYKSDYKNFDIFLIDNKSDNDSIQRILSWANGMRDFDINSKIPHFVFPEIKKPIKVHIVNYNFAQRQIADIGVLKNNLPPGELIFILNDENAGFAAGSNIGIKTVLDFCKSKYIFLLNNDTVIDKSAISELIDKMEKNNIVLANSILYDYYHPEKIVYAGAKFFPWAQTKYYRTIPNNLIRNSPFISGCTMMAKREVFEKYGLLTEKFFHGQEDFDFSWRLRKSGIKSACICSSKVYHKESITLDTIMNKKRRIVLSYLDRVVNMRSYYNSLTWILWKIAVSLYYIYLFIRLAKCSLKESLTIVMKMSQITNKLECVDKFVFDSIIKDY